MFPRGAAPRGRSQFTPSGFPRPAAPRVHNQNDIIVPVQERYHQYEWNPSPVPQPYAEPMTNRRKRQNEDYSPIVVKRQRFDSSSHHGRGSPSIRPLGPRPRHSEEVAGTSRSSSNGFGSHYSPLPNTVPHIPDSLEYYAKDKLSAQMVELFEACHQQMSDLTRKESCRAQLLQDIRRTYAEARLYLTGSSINGLGCRSSDADLCLVIQTKKKADTVLAGLQRLFRSLCSIVSYSLKAPLAYVVRPLLIRAKVPILRFRERDSDVEFDLNVNNTVGIRNTFLLRSYAYADLRIRPLIIVIKKWARHHLINDASKGTLSSYTLVLMVLHYLQVLKEPVLPALQREHPECFDPSMEIDMVPRGSQHLPPFVSRNQSSLGELLLGFLKYYATDFRWDERVISIREATAIPKDNSKEWKNRFICVEEPFERNNVARAVYEKVKFIAIKAQFEEACRRLHRTKDLNSIIPIRAIMNKESRWR